MSGNCKDELKKKAPAAEALDLEKVTAKLTALKGKQYWRHLEELAATPAFEEMLHREFPRHAAVWEDGVSRRNFLQLMGASLALAGLSGCTRQPPENIIPYVRQPEEITPGKPLFFASAMPMGEHTLPVLVRSDMGRPIKIEGNPQHPAGGLATDSFAQASVLEMYDPERSQSVLKLGEQSSWGEFLDVMGPQVAAQKAKQGAGLRFLTGAFTSPTLAAQMQAALKAFPQAKWHVYEPVNHDSARAGAQLAFGQVLEPRHNLASADVIVSLDCDFLNSAHNPEFLQNALQFGRRKKVAGGNLNRLYVVESTLSNTGGKADHRLPVRSSNIETVARAIAAQVSGATAPSGLDAKQTKFVSAVAKDLQAHRGASVVMAGETQPPVVHALAHAINAQLGNVGKTVSYGDPVVALPANFAGSVASLRDLANDIDAGKVELLFIMGTNPCYTAPDDLNFRHTDDPHHNGKYKRYSVLEKVPTRVHLGLYVDDTAQVCQWHVNEAHYLESWSDVRTHDGTVSIVQPLIDPLYGGRSAHELLGVFTDVPNNSSYDWVRGYWQSQHSGTDFEAYWRKAVHDGFIAGTATAPRNATAKPAAALPPAGKPATGEYEIVFRPDPNLFDGRFANNGWLQELPKPISNVVWDNAVFLSLNTAKKLGLTLGGEDSPMVLLNLNGRELEAVAWIVPGQPDDSVTLHLGYGREHAGRTGNAHGYNAYLLRTSDAPLVAAGLKITDAQKRHAVAAVHLHNNVEYDQNGDQEENKRGIIRSATLDEYTMHPDFAHESFEAPSPTFTLYKPKEHPYDPKATPHKWGMAIDLNACIGCNTCVVACQSENNIPVVGDWEVRRGREMHWIRIDNYYLGDYGNPKTHFQPVTCMQCEMAPCEVVCPVGATVHSSEGLNDMVYNRCVGTRYCSNNCPYKVRRFNFMLYADFTTEQYKLRNNPDVSVRSRGVMEKCTYCIQRITRARVEAEEAQVNGKGDGLVADGALSPDPTSLKTACQQACPSEAIVFGNLNDPNSEVSKWQAQKINYGMLAELGTRPRTTYLASVTNPTPELMEPEEMKIHMHVLGRGHEPGAETK